LWPACTPARENALHRLRAAEQRRKDSGEDLRGGGRLQIEGAKVGEDVGEVGSRKHGRNLLRWDDAQGKAAPGGM
jgi:hypothetical protein